MWYILIDKVFDIKFIDIYNETNDFKLYKLLLACKNNFSQIFLIILQTIKNN